MQPADIAIALRRRSPWEAMDLGLSMLQRWWRLVYVPHLMVAAPLWALAFGAGWALERPWLTLVLVWWLKPVNDRVVLHVLSRAVFGERQELRRVFSSAREWLGVSLISQLLLRWWPDMARSFYLPVRQLEGSRGAEGRARRSQLGRRVHGYAVWLTVACLAFEWLVLYLSLGMLAELLLPAAARETRDFFTALFDGDFWTWDDALAYAGAVALLEPFYVAAGFALYLNRRSALEGWDIEVALRKLAERHGAAAAVTAMLLGVFLVLHPQPSLAQKDPKKEIAEVLKAPEFPHEKDVMVWRERNPKEPRKGEAPDLSWLAGLAGALSAAGRVLMWLAIGAAIAYALWWAARMLPAWREPRAEPYRPPQSLFGMELAPETLPADVAAAAAALAAAGKLREALALLYRGALSHLVHRRGVMLLASHTEGEVLGLIPGEKKDYMKGLVDLWRHCAYGRLKPRREEIDALAQGYRGFAA